jgi:hypothetical protein
VVVRRKTAVVVEIVGEVDQHRPAQLLLPILGSECDRKAPAADNRCPGAEPFNRRPCVIDDVGDNDEQALIAVRL